METLHFIQDIARKYGVLACVWFCHCYNIDVVVRRSKYKFVAHYILFMQSETASLAKAVSVGESSRARPKSDHSVSKRAMCLVLSLL